MWFTHPQNLNLRLLTKLREVLIFKAKRKRTIGQRTVRCSGWSEQEGVASKALCLQMVGRGHPAPQSPKHGSTQAIPWSQCPSPVRYPPRGEAPGHRRAGKAPPSPSTTQMCPSGCVKNTINILVGNQLRPWMACLWGIRGRLTVRAGPCCHTVPPAMDTSLHGWEARGDWSWNILSIHMYSYALRYSYFLYTFEIVQYLEMPTYFTQMHGEG